jgi:ATP-binding cassette subfamily F protein 3
VAGEGRAKVFLTRDEKKALARERELRLQAKREKRRQVAALEGEIAKLEGKQRELSERLEQPETYDNSALAMELNRELMGVSDSLERLAAEWEEAVAEVEKMEGEVAEA